MNPIRFVLLAAGSLLLFGTSFSCVRRVTVLPPGPVTISGGVRDATGLPLPNDKMRLFRGRRYLEITTDATGAYTFPNLAAASYLLRPDKYDCRFLPPKADLDHLTSSVKEDFGGFGPGCGGEPTVNMGADTGPLTISGHIRDASGQAIVGARIGLSDDTRAIRFTDLTGGYTFHVKRGDYRLHASGACVITPAEVRREVHSANVTQDFAAGSGCASSSQSHAIATGSVLTVSQGGTVLGMTYVRLEQRAGVADAMARLSEIVAEQATPSRSLAIAGDPAIERQTLITLPGPEMAGNRGPQSQPFLALTTAIASGSTVVRYETQLAGDATPATIAAFVQVGRNFTADSVAGLHGPLPVPVPMTHHTPPLPGPVAPGIMASGVLAPGTLGELEVAASNTANAVIYGTQNGPFVSTDGGQTVNASTYNTAAAPPSAAFNSLGDPSVTVGAPNASFQQTMYFMQLQQAAPPPPNGNLPVAAAGLYQSPNNGQTFNLLSFPVNCSVAAAACVVPDQERLVADRVNQAVTPTGSFDQLYLSWRNFTSQTTNAHTIAVACSQNGGATWTTDLLTLNASGGDFPRMSVGPDGSLIVAYSAGSAVNVQKWASCASGFQPTASGTVAKSVNGVTSMAGLDRSPNGNYSPAFDDGDGSAQTVFVAYSNEASVGNDDIRVAESRDGGKTWTRDSIINAVGAGRRYFPWICSTVGKKFVTWYDRRASSGANPDLTAYYRSTVFDNGSSTSVGIGPELNVSGVNDAQCSPGFLSGVDTAVEQTACLNPPAFVPGGTCQKPCPPGTPGVCGTGNACDFRAATPCTTALEVCTTTRGQPMYGDYNGAGCALGTLFTAWASATPPATAVCLVNGLPSASAAQCCSGILSGGTCAPSAAACTANGGACGPGLTACCNAGIGGLCQSGKCLPAVSMYTGSSCVGPACAGLPVTITYHQTGACDGFPTPGPGVSVGPNQAYLIFGIERINNSGGTTSFAFDPSNLFVQQATQHFFDSSLQLYPNILGPTAVVASTLTAGQNIKFSVSAQGAAVVTTTTTDGAVEANQKSYFLSYNRQPGDPPVNLVKSNAAVTSLPLTQNCQSIVLN